MTSTAGERKHVQVSHRMANNIRPATPPDQSTWPKTVGFVYKKFRREKPGARTGELVIWRQTMHCPKDEGGQVLKPFGLLKPMSKPNAVLYHSRSA